jgi:MFS family permease
VNRSPAAPRSAANVGRALWGVFFIGSGFFNAAVTLPNPGFYRDFADLTFLPFYRSLLLRVALPNATLISALVVIFEFAVGAMVLSKGRAVRWGLIFSALWCLFVWPAMGWYTLGSPVLMIIPWLLMRREYDRSVLDLDLRRWATPNASMTMERNVNKLVWMNVFSNAQFHLVVYTLFLLSKGFSTQQFFLIESGYMLVSLLMEIPTGVFSDKQSRKWSLIAASIIGIPVVPAIILSNSFIVVLAAMSVGGLTSALVSGTDVAILYDTLKALGREDEFKQVTGRIKWHASLSMALAGIVGGLLAQLDMAYAWWAYFGAGLLAMAVKFTLQEPPFFRASEHEEPYLQHLGQSLKLAFAGNATYFILYAAAIWLFFSIGFWLWQPYLQLIAVPVSFFGFLYAALNLVGGFASRQAHRIEGKVGMRNALLFIPLLLGCAFFLESQFVFVLGFLFIFIQSVASGCFSPLLEDYINTRIPSSRRATVLSIKNMVSNVLFMMISPLIGHLVDLYSLTTALLLMGIGVTAASFAFFVAYQKRADVVHQPAG